MSILHRKPAPTIEGRESPTCEQFIKLQDTVDALQDQMLFLQKHVYMLGEMVLKHENIVVNVMDLDRSSVIVRMPKLESALSAKEN